MSEPTKPEAAPAHEGPTVDGHGQAGAHSQAEGHGSGHGFNFEAINSGHNFPYPGIEWVHGSPALILNSADYAVTNWSILSTDPQFAQVPAAKVSAYQTWADQVAAKAMAKAGDKPAWAEHPEHLARAMALADQKAWLGSMPQSLSFLNHQTFWSTIALSLFALVLLVFARRRPDQLAPAGRVQNILETLVLFVRDDIVKPNLAPHHAEPAGAHGHAIAHPEPHPTDRWTPFFASLFFAILVCNLFGLIPLFGTATGHIAVTTAFALITGLLMIALALKKNGVAYFAKQVPIPFKLDPLSLVLWPFLFIIETLQLVIRPAALSIRLFANMLAGHIVLLVFASLGFIVFASDPHNPSLGMSSALGVVGWILSVAFYAFELLVAFLQAYIFTLLSAVFISLCANPEH